MLQTELFETEYVTHYERNNLHYEFPNVGDVTFLNGQCEPVHRWFRLTPSYSPELVRFLAQECECSIDTLVCDPFLGKGTTGIELKKLGIPFVGIEINPLLKLASEFALTWDVELGSFQEHARKLDKKIAIVIDSFRTDSLDDLLKDGRIQLPPIHDVFRWWRKNVLRDLLGVKSIVTRVRNDKYAKLYWLALCSSALDCANIHRNHPTISFDDNHRRKIDVQKDFRDNVEQIVADLEALPHRNGWGTSTIVLGDSTRMDRIVTERISRVITSPPYPNRFSYVHTTRPQLFFMDLFSSPSESAELDCAAIGGTWGKATSVLYDGVVEPKPHLVDVLAETICALRPQSNLMCNYAVKYFNMMDEHIESLRRQVDNGFRGAYVVGNSRLKGVEILTEVVLARSFEFHGFRVDKVLIFRKRGGKKKLYETAICVSL